MSDLDRITPPEKRVKLLDGREIVIKMWPWPLAHKLAPIVARMFQRPSNKGGVETVILESLEDGAIILKETLGWTDEHLNEMVHEDVLSLITAVFDLNVIRRGENGELEGGMMGKLIALGGANPNKLVAQALLSHLKSRRETPSKSSPKPSPSSSEKATPPAPSTDTPPTN